MRQMLMRSVVVGLIVTTLAAAAPAGASVSASYGSAVANTPTVFSKPTNNCLSNCMVGTATFTPSGTVNTSVQMFVYLYRYKSATQTAPVCTAGGACSDTLLTSTSKVFTVTTTSKVPSTLTISTTCSTLQAATTGYYVRVAFSNGNGVGYAESSTVLKAKGC